MERYAPSAKDLASRDVVSRCMTLEIREGRGVGKNKDHIFLHLDHLDPAVSARAPARHLGKRQDLRRRRRDARADPGSADRSLQHGRHSHELLGEVLNADGNNPERLSPGLMAVGEAGCASVHGANRLGSNSLIDLVVFGRAAAIRAGQVIDRNERSRRSTKPPAIASWTASIACAMPPARRRRRCCARRCSAPCRKTQPCSARRNRSKTAASASRPSGRGTARHQGHRPLDGLELRPRGNAGAGKPDGQRHHDRLRRGSPQGKPRRPCPRGLQGRRLSPAATTTRTGASTRWPG